MALKNYKQAMRQFSATEDKTIRTMREKGATGAEIAIELGCHKGAVHRRLREFGLSYPGFWKEKRAELEKKEASKKKAKAKAKAKK